MCFFKKKKKPLFEVTKVEFVIQTYIRTGSLSKTARETGYSERRVKDILIRAGKYSEKRKYNQFK